MPTGADAGYHTLTPRIVTTDLVGLVDLLRAVFGATGDVEPGRPAELRIGDSLVMVSEAGERDVFPAFLYVYVDDVEATWGAGGGGRCRDGRGAARHAVRRSAGDGP